MCGIFGVMNSSQVASSLLDGLGNLEYRGYDSAGVATLVNGNIEVRRAKGKLVNLKNRLRDFPLEGRIGIGHTRWATHGGPSEGNAHPHATDKVVVVHNGIIENYNELRAELQQLGYQFTSETDSEVIPMLMTYYLEQGDTAEQVVPKVLQRLRGSYALAMLFAGMEDRMFVARQGSPLAIGLSDGAFYVASDAAAMGERVDSIIYLEDGDYALLGPEGVTVTDAQGQQVKRALKPLCHKIHSTGKGNYPHYMLKEIHEQPAVIDATLNSLCMADPVTAVLPQLCLELATLPRLSIVACGTSYYAGEVAKYWFGQLAKLPVDIDIASEFRYREPIMMKQGAALFISQSGETADTLAALSCARQQGQRILSLVNVEESSMARAADVVLHTQAGVEIGVASTKAFTTQLTVLAVFAITAARARGHIDAAEEARLLLLLKSVPDHIATVLAKEEQFARLAATICDADDVIYLGRGSCFPIAREGALKLKEISYIHAEGYAAGELKHGPIALIDEKVPVVVLAPRGALFEKTVSNLHEVTARQGRVMLFSDLCGIETLGSEVENSFVMPDLDPFIAPIVYTVAVQLLAYHVAVKRGTDVDQPRNLAKSVTVE